MILGFKEYFPWEKTESIKKCECRKKKTPKQVSPNTVYLCDKCGCAIPQKEPTYFREKILASAGHFLYKHNETFDTPIQKPKLHTIREGDRWKADDLIHMAYGVRTKNYHQFNKGIPELQRVKSVQKIEIKTRITNAWGDQITDEKIRLLQIYIDGKIHGNYPYPSSRRVYSNPYLRENAETLIKNDGFDNPGQFGAWFNKDFTGQIIHWTDLRY